MSGHSKWSTIKRQKGVTDAKRGNVFTKLANIISVAVRENRGVEQAIERARAANMPKDNIQRAVERGSGKSGEAQLQTAVYEGFGPGNCAIVVETISDNTTRTVNELKNVFEKNGGHLAGKGAVDYMFTRVGEIEVENGEAIFEKAVDAGAIDVEGNIVYTRPEDLHKVSEVLGKTGSLIYRPNKETIVTLDPEHHAKLEAFLEVLDTLDDVQEVFVNAA